jgi:hypothetical protein
VIAPDTPREQIDCAIRRIGWLRKYWAYMFPEPDIGKRSTRTGNGFRYATVLIFLPLPIAWSKI